ncbi:AraC family transcriptional regulator [Nocardia sp. NBC_00881]|uniref:AraC family transcriptional regulator n=1 Tax=Nocardia sp. NBC_00881 TaxID=2975995 RepID=UPI003868457E|nr:AraC family transcriptional regulator [Nocardia sp. NBC_00881]
MSRRAADDRGKGDSRIISQRLDRVRTDSTNPDDMHRTIAMILRRWGFRDPSYFVRRFRAAYGLSPWEWRRVATAEGEP